MGSGVHSVLEHRYLTRVERPHGLPRGVRQRLVRIDDQWLVDDTYSIDLPAE